MEKIILTDCDGVICDWEWAFHIWMQKNGFTMQKDGKLNYSINKRYGIDSVTGRNCIKLFNESAAIGFLPALRDAQHYIKLLHQEHGYRFHCITSLSTDPNAQELRKMNIEKLFGKTAFEEYIFLETGAAKDEVLSQYSNTNLWWIEDKYVNCLAGLHVGLRPILVEHGHSLDFVHPEIHKVKTWKEIYQLVLGIV
jgi:hypothetical protein